MSQVILFDLDGTLTESGEGIINCVQYALEKLGKKEEHPENLQCFIGPPLKEQFMKYAGLGEEEGEKAVVYYRERYTTTGIFENRLYPKIPELLELLKINNKILAVASSKPEVYVKQILEHFQIAIILLRLWEVNLTEEERRRRRLLKRLYGGCIWKKNGTRFLW